MNYNIRMYGIQRKIFDKTAKLLIQTFTKSDYSMVANSRIPDNYFAPLKLKIKITGSQKNTFKDIYLDYDNILLNMSKSEDYISPFTLNMKYFPSGLHYWAVTGTLFQLIEDISSGYISGCLLEEKMQKELEYFRKFTS